MIKFEDLLFFFIGFAAALVVSLGHLSLPFEGTVGSDSYFYFLKMLDDNSSCIDHEASGKAFVCFGKVLFLISPINQHFILVCALYVIYAIIVVCMLKSFERDIAKVMLLVYLNPIIIWTISRGLKEVLIFASLAVAFIILERKKYTLFWLFLICILLEYTKPSGGLMLLISLFLAHFTSKIRNQKLAILAISSCMVFVILRAQEFLQDSAIFMHRSLTLGQENAVSLISFGKNAIRFLLGPGPIRAVENFFYSNSFLVSSKVGDIYIFFGALLWWILVAGFAFIFGLKLLNMGSNTSHTRLDKPRLLFFWYGLIYTFSYTVAYDGTGDTRHRAVLYFCWSMLIVEYIFSIRKSFSLKTT